MRLQQFKSLQYIGFCSFLGEIVLDKMYKLYKNGCKMFRLMLNQRTLGLVHIMSITICMSGAWLSFQ